MIIFCYIELMASIIASIAGLLYYRKHKKRLKLVLASILFMIAEIRWIMYYSEAISNLDDVLWTAIEMLFIISALEVFFNE